HHPLLRVVPDVVRLFLRDPVVRAGLRLTAHRDLLVADELQPAGHLGAGVTAQQRDRAVAIRRAGQLPAAGRPGVGTHAALLAVARPHQRVAVEACADLELLTLLLAAALEGAQLAAVPRLVAGVAVGVHGDAQHGDVDVRLASEADRAVAVALDRHAVVAG